MNFEKRIFKENHFSGLQSLPLLGWRGKLKEVQNPPPLRREKLGTRNYFWGEEITVTIYKTNYDEALKINNESERH